MKGALDQSVVQLLAKARRDCESAHVQGASEAGKSRIWYRSPSLLNCSGKERLPLSADVRQGTPPPYFDVTPMGTWDRSRVACYQHGAGNA